MNALEHVKIPARLRVAIGESAELLVAASGFMSLVVIVLVMATMMRAVRMLHGR